jgi:hypothetical protein
VTEKARDGDDRRTFLDGQRRGGVAQVVWRDFQSQRLDRGIENVASPVTVAQRCAFSEGNTSPSGLLCAL